MISKLSQKLSGNNNGSKKMSQTMSEHFGGSRRDSNIPRPNTAQGSANASVKSGLKTPTQLSGSRNSIFNQKRLSNAQKLDAFITK
jgi:hypothetical protein